jgi:steroid 5-alpha reductase family enzyme
MDLYSRKARSLPEKLFITATQIAFILLSAWLMFGSGGEALGGWLGTEPFSGNPFRSGLILAFSIVSLCRFGAMMFVWLNRAIAPAEMVSVPVAFFLYYVVFAALSLGHPGPLDLFDAAGAMLFGAGATLNTVSELQRRDFKVDPANTGKLFTGGLFAFSMHPNYLGDVLWVTGYALIAHSIWGGIIPLVLLGFFVFEGIPALDRYLAGRYGDAFATYAAKTKKLVPFVW